MKLLAKFNLLLLVAFGIGLATISMSARSFLLQGAREQVLQQAALVAASATATRDYTAEEVSPTLEKTPEHAAIFLPLRTISESADRISTGELDLPQLEVKGKDELAEVTSSFNRMHTSLKKAFDLLNG